MALVALITAECVTSIYVLGFSNYQKHAVLKTALMDTTLGLGQG